MVKIVSLITIFVSIVSYIFFDRDIALYFNSHKDFFEIFNIITKFGDSKYYILISLLIFLVTYILEKRGINRFFKLKRASLLIFLTIIFSGLIVNILKVIFARFRPKAYILDGSYGFNWFEFGYIVNSFPSGHSATAFSIFVALSFLYKKLAPLFIFIALLIAFSRVVIVAHYLSDILIGSLIGVLSSIYLYKKMYKER